MHKTGSMTNELTQAEIDILNEFAKSKGKTYLQLIDAFTDIVYTQLQINEFGYYGGRLVDMIRNDIIKTNANETNLGADQNRTHGKD